MFSVMSKFSKAAALLAAAAPVALGVASLLLALNVPPVRNWFWHVEALNVAEAAALRDLARVRELVEDGASPNAPSRVRPGILGDAEVEMTPLEAAIRIGADDVVELLVQLGASRGPYN